MEDGGMLITMGPYYIRERSNYLRGSIDLLLFLFFFSFLPSFFPFFSFLCFFFFFLNLFIVALF